MFCIFRLQKWKVLKFFFASFAAKQANVVKKFWYRHKGGVTQLRKRFEIFGVEIDSVLSTHFMISDEMLFFKFNLKSWA